jgi:hypothetical protein
VAAQQQHGEGVVIVRDSGRLGLLCRPVDLAAPARDRAALFVDEAAGGRGEQPATRVVGDAVARPGRVGGDEGLLGGVLGGREVA